MSKTLVQITLLMVVTFLLPADYIVKNIKKSNAIMTGFTIIKNTKNSGKIKINTGNGFEKIQVGKFYTFPVTLKSRTSQIFIEFSEGNICKLLPRTTLYLASPKARHPKLRLIKGAIKLTLDKMPKNHKLEVETPTAICGAVGTHFEVSFSGDEAQNNDGQKLGKFKNSFKCSKGEIFMKSNSFKITKIKEDVSVVASIHKGKTNSFASLELNKPDSAKSFKIEMNGQDYIVENDTSFDIAQSTVKENELTVIKFNKGTVLKSKVFWMFGGGPLKVEEGRSYVKVGNKLYQNDDTEAYLAAAQKEGELDTELRFLQASFKIEDKETQNMLVAKIETVKEKRNIAAIEADNIRKRILKAKKMWKAIKHIRGRFIQDQQRNQKIRH